MCKNSNIHKKREMRNMKLEKFIPFDLIEQLNVGQVVSGKVKSIQPYGAFIELDNGIVGLLHIEDISVVRIKTPKDRFYIGEQIDVIIKNIDLQLGRVEFTHKELLGSWDENVQGLQEGSTVPGIIRQTEKNKNGIFIELKPNLVGMAEYEEGLQYGQNVDVYIKKIIKDKKKIKLIIK